MLLIDVDSWREIAESLSRHKLRSALTAFGVFWGIFMLVNLLGAGKGLKNGANANMGKANNAIVLWGGRPTSIPYKGLKGGRSIRLQDSDVEAMYEKLPSIEVISPRNGMGTQFVTHNEKGDSFDINGIIPEQQAIRGYKLLEGRFLNQLDQNQGRKNIVIGGRVKEILFDKEEAPIGQLLNVRGIPFMVVGVIQPSALNSWAQRENSVIFLPHSTIRKAFNQGDRIHSMFILPKLGHSAYRLEEQIVNLLKEEHKIHPNDHGVIGSYNSQKDFDNVRSLFGGITAFSWVVAIGTIIAGAVGVGNIMLISVKERTKEIGIRRAVGATPLNIVSSIMKESLVITFFAGYTGLVAGVISIEVMSKIAGSAKGGFGSFVNPEVSFSTAFAAIGVLLIAGTLAALLPARKAAQVDPVIALQSE